MKTAGVVLAGGKSSRFGKPKMFESHEGKAFYEHSLDALKVNQLSPLVISTNHELVHRFEREDVRLIVEEESNSYQGPLYAIHNVISKMDDTEWFFILSCDIPYVTAEFVKEMVSFAEESEADAVVPVQGGRIQPLMALYHKKTETNFEKMLAADDHKLVHLLNDLHVLTIPFAEDDPAFININTATDWNNDY
ncbi:NTP transferase domain-containing protein [Bacillus mangrovi]|uniref:Probable molybdenum cofactor guanylyltransferase n=1 Tax=Metabacillus mangrovi TaxID=1491830 RepID=A0A7X2S342_9BACI|nr:molybdenum cofactor guanylyltransferase [Metabacillus mangrovi]MTH51936.1 NTP transferase domain-containing protein [Metabacillus mangrovi]